MTPSVLQQPPAVQEEMHSSEKDYLRLRQKWTKEIGEQRNTDIALHETSRELESQRLELYQANQWG